MPDRAEIGRRVEAIVASALRGVGWHVLNLDEEIAGHFPVIDLIARKGTSRCVIQVRGTTNDHGSYTARPVDARRAESFGEWLGHPALYAFVLLTGGNATIRFATASQVAALAEAAEADYPGTLRYHVFIDQFDIDVDRIDELLDPLS
jgi:hypothetical protein